MIERLRSALQEPAECALFVTELSARVGSDDNEFEIALADLRNAGECLVVEHSFSDPHVEGDLRVAALVTDVRSPRDAAEAARRVWDQWLREFLRTHRCS